MRKLLSLVTLLIPSLARATEAGPAPGTKLAAPIVFKQLTVFPVIQEKAVVGAQYLTLKEGLAKKLVRVVELDRGGSVNRVKVHNGSDKPLLLLGGEVLLGGQQDRILGKDTVVPAREWMALEVFCVEHGRWAGGRAFGASGGMADSKLRVRAKFRSDQSQVWAEVAKKNAALKAAPSTGTYRNLAAGSEGDKAKKPYRDHVAAELAKIPEAAKLVGLVAAVNGRVVSADLFQTPSLFASYKEQLLDSIVMSAVDVPIAPAAPAATPAKVREFVAEAEKAPEQPVMRNKASRTTKKESSRLLKSSVRDSNDSVLYDSFHANE